MPTTSQTARAGRPRLVTDGAAPVTEGTQARILATARDLFVTQGFAATTTRELAARLGLTKAALYYYFHTKDDLLAALTAPIVDAMRKVIDRAELSTEPAARRQLLAAYLDIAIPDLDLIRVLTQDPSARRPSTAEHAALYERMLQLLAGDPNPGTAALVHARAALGAIWAGLFHAGPQEDTAVLRDETLAAACGALGIRSARRR